MRISDWSSDVCSSDLLDSRIVARDEFLGAATGMLEEIQQALLSDAQARLLGNIDKSVTSLDGLKAYFGASKKPGWALVQEAGPNGAVLATVAEWLNGETLTLSKVGRAKCRERGW